MRRALIPILALVAGCSIVSDDNYVHMQTDGLLGSGLGATRITIESSNVVRRAWRRDVVTVNQLGEISGDGGIVGEKASTDAIDTMANELYQISQAASDAMTNAMEYVYSKTNQVANNCVKIALSVPPETVNSNITGYVVKTESDGTNDTQWVWYDRVLGLKPIRYVTYAYYGGSANVKCTWDNWTTNGVSVTVAGRTWTGCHQCTVVRPDFAKGMSCLDLPNEEWGGASGINWGDMVLMYDESTPYYTGFVTNGITNEVLYFDNGALKANP